jgi:hypothetical protein
LQIAIWKNERLHSSVLNWLWQLCFRIIRIYRRPREVLKVSLFLLMALMLLFSDFEFCFLDDLFISEKHYLFRCFSQTVALWPVYFGSSFQIKTKSTLLTTRQSENH